MMETIIDIPAPAPEDSETVAAALETAAVYGARGDAAEALRWLKRAAESAGDSGDDVRTLSLARLAADISSQIRQSQSLPPPTRQLPKPPSRSPRTPPPSPRAGSSAPEPEPRVATTESVSESPAAQSVSAVPRSVPLPLPRAPVQRAEPLDAAAEAPPVRRYALPSSRPPTQHSRRARSTPSSGPSEASIESELGSASGEAERASATPEPEAEAVATSSEQASTPPAMEPDTSDSAPAMADFPSPMVETVVESPIAAGSPGHLAEAETEEPESERLRQPEQQASSDAEPSNDTPRLRKAARVSVVPSLIEPGLFLVRLLEEDGALPSNATEGLLVVMDPETQVFHRSAGQYLDRNH